MPFEYTEGTVVKGLVSSRISEKGLGGTLKDVGTLCFERMTNVHYGNKTLEKRVKRLEDF